MTLVLDPYSKSVPGSAHAYEERMLVDEERKLYAVADGVTISSQGSGGVAAELALRLLKEIFSGDLIGAVEEVHRRLVDLKRADRNIGETTLTAAHLVDNNRAEIVNIGDSPGYLLRGGDLRVLTHADKNELGYIPQALGS
jgi:serine/threonine protein phosphatase PrpC